MYSPAISGDHAQVAQIYDVDHTHKTRNATITTNDTGRGNCITQITSLIFLEEIFPVLLTSNDGFCIASSESCYGKVPLTVLVRSIPQAESDECSSVYTPYTIHTLAPLTFCSFSSRNW